MPTNRQWQIMHDYLASTGAAWKFDNLSAQMVERITIYGRPVPWPKKSLILVSVCIMGEWYDVATYVSPIDKPLHILRRIKDGYARIMQEVTGANA